MMLKEVIKKVIELYEAGLSLIPVRDREVEENGVWKGAKTPCGPWTKSQRVRISVGDLFSAMERYSTTAVAIVCGPVSGNLEVIDIDSKYKPGCEAKLFSDIEDFCPDLFHRLRIHKTPSGGYHILYRIKAGEVPDGFPRNRKLAGYVDEEGRQRNFLETRGDKGYVLAPPSLGYFVHQDVPIPVISWAERCALISLCESHNEIVKVEKMPKAASFKSDYYSESPYENFTRSDAATQVLLSNGWKKYKEDNFRVYYTRPGKDSGVSASFHKEHRYYYFFTSSTVFEPGKGYFPGYVLAMLEHDGDHKATFRRLESECYGKIHPSVEKNIIERAANKGCELPSNISSEAREQYLQLKARLEETHPKGVFWEYTSKGEIKINRQKILEVAEALGFRRYLGAPVRIIGYKVLQQEDEQVYNTLKDYIQANDTNEGYRIQDVYEAFLQHSGKFTLDRLPKLDESLMLSSTATVSYKFHLNGYLAITKDRYELHNYSTLEDKLVWEPSILKRVFVPREDYDRSHYYHFLNNAIGISDHLMQVIGFYAHDYKDETMGYIGVMVEQVANPEDGGGAGKNVFANLLRLTTTMRTVPGSQVDWSDKLLSTWNLERIFSISDAPKKTDYAFLKELSTGEGAFKRLFKDPVIIPCRSMPKFLISTNFSYELSDGGLKRRIIPIEFTDFYTLNGGVDKVHGGHFPNDWDEEEFQWYDNVIIKAIQSFLRADCKLTAPSLTETGWEKQFKQNHGEPTWNFIQENWEEWLKKKNVLPEEFNRSYTEFCTRNSVSGRFQKAKHSLNKALTEFAKHQKVKYHPSKSVRFDGVTMKCQVFD